MRKNLIISMIITALFLSCKSDLDKTQENEYPKRWIGDIEHDSLIDKQEFKVCNNENEIFQYFNFGDGPQYLGEKPNLTKAFNTKYIPVLGENQNGFIRIRFIVNCQGEAGRFRVLQSDPNFNETEFDEKLVSQLTDITKEIEGWVIVYNDENKPIDYYYYLVFKIIDGNITEILP